ncbi:NAD(P)H-dependent flavin oxidoreductase [Pseudacidovorax sp. NFM-22]|uniref:NAD(P)H-dependent flavin oxidoreductase n=1 Tax=Pseudacidovorax sp. NFM-22 TaxID=2744469 RepID=UPI001F2A0CF9|nr:nitronate monooxygenase [Pseudacidovorax sp. NFM-22]
MSISDELAARLRLPLIAAPMLHVSGPELVIAACRSGVMGAFPTANAARAGGLDAWLERICGALGPTDAPCCPNLILHRPRPQIEADIEAIRRYRVEWVITSVGSAAPVVGPLHDAGCRVLADVGTVAHARKAVQSGVDGLVLLSAGAGGQTGWLNGLAFVRAVRIFFDGPLVLAGGVADGAALWAARAAGADLAYMGTRFIATRESMAAPGYKAMLVESGPDDVLLTRAFTGLRTNMLRASIEAAGLDPDALQEDVTPEQARALFGGARATFEMAQDPAAAPQRWRDIWSAGHSVGGVHAVTGVAELIQATRQEYRAAMERSLADLRAAGLAR